MLILLFLAAADVSAKAPAPAAPIRFGAVSDVVWTTGTALRFNASAPMIATRPAGVPTAMNSAGDFSGEAILSLAVDYFIAKNISIGGFARGSYNWSPAAYGPGFGVGPRIGYNLAFSDWASLWPRLDLSFGAQGTFVRNQAMAPGMIDGMLWYFNAQMNLPLVFTFFNHAIFGIGPFFAFEPQWLGGNGSLQAFAFNFGLSTFVGIHY